MDLYGKLQLKWSLGYDGSPIHFVDSSTLLYSGGNVLTLIHHSGRHVRSLPSHGRGVGPVATAPKANLIVYAESTLKPKIFAISYPKLELTATLKGGAELEYVSLAVSDNGKRLASLSGVPDFLLILWDLTEGCELCRTSVGQGASQLSINPLNWKQLCVLGDGRLSLCSMEKCDDQLMITSQETRIPDKSTPVGTITHPPLPPLSLHKKSSSPDQAGAKLTTSDHFKSPDLSQVLYKETYDEFTKDKNPVVLASHCWTSKQTIYVGCQGGQLLLADFDSGTINMVANPQLAEISTHSLESQSPSTPLTTMGRGVQDKQGGEGAPHTGHAVLREASLDCLAFSRRGLFAAGKNGTIFCFELSDELKVLESHGLHQSHSISCLSWSPDYVRMAIGTHQGAIHIADPLHLSKSHLLSDHGHHPIVGLDLLTPGSAHCVTCRSDGTLQVWDMEDGGCVSSYSLEQECTCLACPLSCHMAAVGTESGHLCVVGLTQPASPSLLRRFLLSHSPLTTIRYDQNGKFLTTASSHGPVFLCSALPTTDFKVLGYTATKGEVLDLSLLTMEPGNEGNTLAAVLTKHDNKTIITLFQMPNSIIEKAPPELYTGTTKEFSSDFIWKQEATLTEHVSMFVLSSQTTAFAPLDSSLKLARFSLPPLKEKNVDWELSPDAKYHAHDMNNVQLSLSFHQKWIASAAGDGKLLLRLVENPEKAVVYYPHHYQTSGCKAVVISRDCQCILTVGDKGTVTCWNWEFTNHGSTKANSAAEYTKRVLRSLDSQHSRENAALEAMQEVEKRPPQAEQTWLEAVEEEVHKAEDESHTEMKSELRQEIGQLREKLLAMISANEQAPDLEKLDREEFILDMEEHDRLQAEKEELIRQVREEIELSNLAKMYLREQIKRECWDSMTAKGKVIKGFQGTLEVSSYPMKERSEEKLRELARVQTLRGIEKADKKVRQEAAASLERENIEDLLLGSEGLLGEGDRDEDQAGKEEEKGDSDALLGSHGPKYGGGCELLYEQFELHSPVAKKHQIVLLEDCIHRIKKTFNKEFEEVFRLKQAEIARIKEKNMRIRKIINQLQLDEDLVQPSLLPEEQPESFLSVQDNEVTVEKYLSPEERKRQEEMARLEEERRLAEMGDNPRERALDMMMGGRLEANVEEDLFKDLPRPDFMQKEPAEMSEEEIRAAREFEKKEQAFLEEREKLKKALEAELRKLQSSITQAMENFSERLQNLFQLKINTEMAVHQEELKILSLVQALQVEEEVRKREDQLNQLLQTKKTMKARLSSVISSAKRKIDGFREHYEQLVAEDKEMERSFKRDFSDCEPYVDQLYKLFKKRPRGQRLKPGPSEGGLVPDPKSQNPFPQRPPSAVGQKAVARSGEDPMSELDHVSHVPEGVEGSQWERLVVARRRKWESEQKVKNVALQLADMESFLKRRQVEEERVQQEIQDAFRELNRLGEDQTMYNLDLRVQLLLKQGQVEVEEGEFIPDFSGSVLVHRKVIEELNKEIKVCVPPSEAGAKQRMADIVARRRLVELARAQAQEISVLRTEVERLRMGTFPALVQVD